MSYNANTYVSLCLLIYCKISVGSFVIYKIVKIFVSSLSDDKKKNAVRTWFSSPVKIQWDRLQATYLLTEQTQIWYQPKHSVQLQAQQHSASLTVHFSSFTVHKNAACESHGSSESRPPARWWIGDEYVCIALIIGRTHSKPMPEYQFKWLNGWVKYCTCPLQMCC